MREAEATIGAPAGLLVRALKRDGGHVRFSIDGTWATAHVGESILAAILTNTAFLRQVEFGGEPRAGFCLMGACQDCWVWTEEGRRILSCTTPITDGLRLRTTAPDVPGSDNG
jgi:predicted molibdopterin-dependent oxidoreductase YjgC